MSSKFTIEETGVAAGAVMVPNVVRRQVPTVQMALDEKTRTVTHMISSARADRAGDVVVPQGADLEAYRRNPVVLADHRYSIESIIGRSVGIKREGDNLIASTQFDTEGIGARAWGLVQRGVAKAWSIGFRPTKYEAVYEEFEDGSKQFKGVRYDEWEMLEYSLVAIGMNSDAVTEAVQCGMIHSNDVGRLWVPNVSTTGDETTPEAASNASADDGESSDGTESRLYKSLIWADTFLQRHEESVRIAAQLED